MVFRFKAGRTSTDDDERSGRPVSSSVPEMIERVRQIIREARRRTIDEVSMLKGISHGACHKILTEDLKMRRVASKFVPRLLLSVDQKQQRLDVCVDLKENATNKPSFLLNVIMGDETWVYAYDPATKTFTKLKMKLKGRRFQTEEIQAESQAILNKL